MAATTLGSHATGGRSLSMRKVSRADTMRSGTPRGDVVGDPGSPTLPIASAMERALLPVPAKLAISSMKSSRQFLSSDAIRWGSTRFGKSGLPSSQKMCP